MLLDIQPLRDALEQVTTGQTAAEQEPQNELLRDGVIQRFEYSHELCLKFIRRVLEVVFGDDVDRMAYNDVLRTAAERGLIADIEPWLQYRAARNKTSHTYDARVAAEVYQVVHPFLTDARSLLDHIHAVLDRPHA